MCAQKIMLIRHGEKAGDPDPSRGVDEHGGGDVQSLSIRGWQRAGALVRFFSNRALAKETGIAVPSFLFACAVALGHESKRCEQTLAPLSRNLGIPVRTGYTKGDEESFANAVELIDEHVLVCWEHEMLPSLGCALTGRGNKVPDVWPEDRYDLIWIFERKRGKRRFEQIGQRLLAGDNSEPIE
jgi:hypothetical protein